MKLKDVKNLGLLAGDAENLVSNNIANRSIKEIYINFPEPPHSGEDKLFNHSFIDRLKGILTKDGKVYVLTDDEAYKCKIHSLFMDHKFICEIDGEKEQVGEVFKHNSFFDEIWEKRGRDKRFYLLYSLQNQ
eukprot:TRINITY_DN1878_c0_g1_i1.p1 TRINITY_DN1878_c0_g1~~TRINITY_DN1878_c0_g1_i1.p1  ORF type:complete len:132 (-),score=33.55 TRINITY_DN1878_c0_g1_i1:99-494(-)